MSTREDEVAAAVYSIYAERRVLPTRTRSRRRSPIAMLVQAAWQGVYIATGLFVIHF